jgi:hypothetical protein
MLSGVTRDFDKSGPAKTTDKHRVPAITAFEDPILRDTSSPEEVAMEYPDLA